MKKVLILIFLLNCLLLIAGETKIDSLENALFTASGSQRISILHELATEYWDVDAEKSIEYGNKEYKLAVKESVFSAQIDALIDIAVGYETINDSLAAKKYYLKAINLAKQKDNRKKLARAEKDYGIFLETKKEYSEALKHLVSALNLYREMNDKIQMSYVLQSIVSIYSQKRDYEKAQIYANQNLKIAAESKDKVIIADSYLISGNLEEKLHHYNAAISYYQKAKDIYLSINNSDGLSSCLNLLGNINETLGDYPKALSYFYNSLKIYQENDDKEGLSVAYNNIGNIFYDLKEYNKAAEFYRKSDKTYKSLNDTVERVTYFVNMANIFGEQKQYRKALEFYQNALEISKKYGVQEDISTCLNNIGTIYIEQKRYDEAISLFLKSLKLVTELKDKWAIANISNNIGETYYKKGQYKAALQYVRKGLDISCRLHFKDVEIESDDLLAKIYAALSDYQKAYNYLQKFRALQDTLYFEQLGKISSLETKFAKEKNEKEIRLLQKQKKYQKMIKEIFLVVSFFAFIVIFWLIFLYNRNQQEIKKRKNAEIGLRENERKYRSLTENLRAAVFTFNEEGYFTYVNPATINITGYSETELLSMKFYEIVHPDFVRVVKERGIRRVEGEHPISHYEFCILTKHREERWVEISNVLIEINGEKMVLGTAIDITENKKAQLVQNVLYQILKELNTNDGLQDLFTAIHNYLAELMNVDNFYIALYDEKTNIITAPFYLDKFKVTPEPQQLGNGLTAYVIHNRKPLFLTEAKRKEIIKDKLIPDREWKSKIWLGVPLVSEGKVIGAIALQSYDDAEIYTEDDLKILELVSDQVALAIEKKRAEEALRDSEARFREIVSDQTELICRSDPKAKLTFVNQAFCKYFHKSEAELLGEKLIDYILPEDVEPIRDKLRKLNILNPLIIHEHRMIINKQIRWVEWTDRKLFNKRGDYIGFQSVGRDVTERKRWEERLQDSLKEKEILLQEIHHRVKNNMQVISSLLKLQSSRLTDQNIKSLFMESYNRVRSMALIHENLYQSSDLTKIDFYSYTKSLINNLIITYGVDQSKIKFTIDIDKVFLNINMAIPCGLIINELISNSLKYAFPHQEEGVISVKMNFDDETENYEMIVSDDGIGLPPDFDFHNSSTFGIELVHILTQQLHGKIEINNNNGTSIRFLFKNRK